jgi:hypothetical protein
MRRTIGDHRGVLDPPEVDIPLVVLRLTRRHGRWEALPRSMRLLALPAFQRSGGARHDLEGGRNCRWHAKHRWLRRLRLDARDLEYLPRALRIRAIGDLWLKVNTKHQSDAGSHYGANLKPHHITTS